MAFTVSARDYESLEHCIKTGRPYELPEEVARSRIVFKELLGYAKKVLPDFAVLEQKEVQQIADIVAYLVRTDMVMRMWLPGLVLRRLQKDSTLIFKELGTTETDSD